MAISTLSHRKRQSMGDRLSHDFQSIVPYLPPALVSTEAIARLQTLANHLPSFPYAGLECRLGVDRGPVDLQVCMPPSIPAIAPQCLSHPVWQQIMAMLTHWAEPTSELHQHVRDLWWEFDATSHTDAIPLPSVFFTLNRNLDVHSNAQLNVLKMLLHTLHLEFSDGISTLLDQCYRALPIGATISHFGVMIARQPQTIRLNITGLSAADFLQFWHCISTASLAAVRDLISTLETQVDALMFAIDISDRITPTVGIECFFAKQPPTEPRWRSLLEQWVEQGWCTAENCEAGLSWPGLLHHAEPTDGFAGDRYFLGRRAQSVMWRSLNHVKLVIKPHQDITAKAYLAFGRRWVERPTNLCQ